MSRTAPLSCLLVDDHALFADGLKLLLTGLAEAVSVEVVASCERALQRLDAGPSPDLILFDLALPGTSHLDAFRLLHERAPGVPIVAVSADERPRMIADVVRAGARGYIPKSTNAEVTLSALRLVLAGGSYVPQSVVLEGSQARSDTALTARELQVLELLAAGQGNKAMAAQLGMAESTVRVHVTSILRRLGVSSRVEAATSPVARSLLRQRAVQGRES
jgi:DNA-binding NarL/FixJ family response regulator